MLFILPAYLSTKPGVDPFWLETAGLAQALGSLVERCDVLTPYGVFAPSQLKGFALQRAAPPGTLRRSLHRLPQMIRVLLGDGRSWWRAQQLKKQAVTAARAASYQLVIQVHRRFHTAGQHAARESGTPFVLKMVALEKGRNKRGGASIAHGVPWLNVSESSGSSGRPTLWCLCQPSWTHRSPRSVCPTTSGSLSTMRSISSCSRQLGIVRSLGHESSDRASWLAGGQLFPTLPWASSASRYRATP